MKFYIKDMKTDEVIKEIDVTGKSERSTDRIEMGLLLRMDTDKYYLDTEEVDKHWGII